jgi:hypothetical protein
MTITIIDLDKLAPGLADKVENYGGVTLFIDTEDQYGLMNLIEVGSGWDWKEISQCERKGAKKLSVVKGIKKDEA